MYSGAAAAPKTGNAYFTYITPEAYRELAAWMKYRADCGEKVTSTSWVMRDLWDTVAAIRKYTHTQQVL